MTCCPIPSDQPTEFTPAVFKPSPDAVRPASVSIPAGLGLLGTSRPLIPFDGEGPLREKALNAFRMSCGSITNAQFAAFVNDTGYLTEAEHHGWSFVFWHQVPEYVGATQGVANSAWWRRVEAACWQRITGPQCTYASRHPEHPVVHVSWNDARAYCSWIGGRLPSELEWEHAARGGLGDVRFPWGDAEPDDERFFPCNIWQGQFPESNTTRDGYASTAPSVSFEPNGYGLYNMVGNVWDWTEDTFTVPNRRTRSGRDTTAVLKLAKGGSFLCHRSYCFRYRIASRIGNPRDSTTTHMGFRVVWDENSI